MPTPARLAGARARFARAAAVVALAVLAEPGAAADSGPTEYEVKAAFLFHFARLTEWPARALPAGRPLVVGVLGPDPFGPVLDRTLAGQTVQDRPVQVQRYGSLEQVRDAPHILFVASSRAVELASILDRFKGEPVLVVSDVESPTIMVAFRVTPEGKVRFDINPAECQARGISMSSQVLKLARIVADPPR